MIPHTLQFITTITIDKIGYMELLKQGYSDSQIETFIKQKISYAFDLRRLGIASEGITLEHTDDYTIIRKPLPINYSTITGEGNDVNSIKRTDKTWTEVSGNNPELYAHKREW